MKDITCDYSKCPKTDRRIIIQLCEMFYPYGGLGCNKVFSKWLENDKYVQEAHREYLERKGTNK